MQIIFRDLTTNKQSVLPVLPVGGQLISERPHTTSERPIIGNKPHVQLVAPGAQRLTMQLELYGEQGRRFYDQVIEPSYGQAGSGFRPHLMQVSWGFSSNETFTGRPEGKQPTTMRLGRSTGDIFLYSFEYKLVETVTIQPVIIDTKTRAVGVSNAVRHVVASYESLQTIAAKYGVSLSLVAEANNNPPFFPRVGTVLYIPRGQK